MYRAAFLPMQATVDRKHLLELHEMARSAGLRYPARRSLSDLLLTSVGKHFTCVLGPRGVGKTVLLEQMIPVFDRSFYLSLDTLEECDLFDLVKGLKKDYGFEVFLPDEVHFCRDIGAVLKKVFDFLDVRVVFTGSVALSVLESVQDLSRRVRVMQMLPFSFREYLRFEHGLDLPPLRIEDIEVGGRGKGRTQFRGVDVAKRMILTHSDSTRGLHRPLHMLGFVDSRLAGPDPGGSTGEFKRSPSGRPCARYSQGLTRLNMMSFQVSWSYHTSP